MCINRQGTRYEGWRLIRTEACAQGNPMLADVFYSVGTDRTGGVATNDV